MVASSTDTTSCGGQSDWVYQNSFDILIPHHEIYEIYILYTHTHNFHIYYEVNVRIALRLEQTQMLISQKLNFVK